MRAISIVAIEASSREVAADLQDSIADLAERLNDEEGFHVGGLERLAGVRRQDLSNYFRDRQLCSCDDRYREEFPQLLLSGRREISCHGYDLLAAPG